MADINSLGLKAKPNNPDILTPTGPSLANGAATFVKAEGTPNIHQPVGPAASHASVFGKAEPLPDAFVTYDPNSRLNNDSVMEPVIEHANNAFSNTSGSKAGSLKDVLGDKATISPGATTEFGPGGRLDTDSIKEKMVDRAGAAFENASGESVGAFKDVLGDKATIDPRALHTVGSGGQSDVGSIREKAAGKISDVFDNITSGSNNRPGSGTGHAGSLQEAAEAAGFVFDPSPFIYTPQAANIIEHLNNFTDKLGGSSAMAEFDVTISSMSEAANNIRTYCDDFKSTADELKQATETLTTSSDGWDSEASKIFNENIVEAHRWMSEMGAIIDEYAAMLDKAVETYQSADQASAKNFR